jgi:hypothetical protein
MDYDEDAEVLDAVENPLYFDTFSGALSLMRGDDVEKHHSDVDPTLFDDDHQPSWATGPSPRGQQSGGNHNIPFPIKSAFGTNKPTAAEIAKEREDTIHNILNKYTKVSATDGESVGNGSGSGKDSIRGSSKGPTSSREYKTSDELLLESSMISSSTTMAKSYVNSNQPQYQSQTIAQQTLSASKQSTTATKISNPSPNSSVVKERSVSVDSDSSANVGTGKGSSRIRASKFRHVYATQVKIENTFHNLRVSNISGDQNFIKANHLFFAIGIEVNQIYNHSFYL